MDMCKIPDGLYELCSDISMEVLRIQPDDIYAFIASYLDVLLITRENAKCAVKIVQDIVLNSEKIVDVLCSSGLNIKEIAAAAPRLQEAFRNYLDIVESSKKKCGCDVDEDDDEISICRILNETGVIYEEAETATKKIQSIFRAHYEQVLIAEERNEIQWERANMKTKHILLKLNITEERATQAAMIIQTAYRKYYTTKMHPNEGEICNDEKLKEDDISAWLDMMFEYTGLTLEKANSAASIIQRVFRKYRNKKDSKSFKHLLKTSAALNKDDSSKNIINMLLENLENVETYENFDAEDEANASPDVVKEEIANKEEDVKEEKNISEKAVEETGQQQVEPKTENEETVKTEGGENTETTAESKEEIKTDDIKKEGMENSGETAETKPTENEAPENNAEVKKEPTDNAEESAEETKQDAKDDVKAEPEDGEAPKTENPE